MQKAVILLLSHLTVALLGFVLGIYALPILIAPEAPTEAEVREASSAATFTGTFRRDLKDSDMFHWGEGTVFVASDAISLEGALAPGPDYKLYFSPEFVETEIDFNRIKPTMVRVGDVKTFNNFVVPVPAGINPGDYVAVIVWCETFGQFITAAQYR